MKSKTNKNEDIKLSETSDFDLPAFNLDEFDTDKSKTNSASNDKEIEDKTRSSFASQEDIDVNNNDYDQTETNNHDSTPSYNIKEYDIAVDLLEGYKAKKKGIGQLHKALKIFEKLSKKNYKDSRQKWKEAYSLFSKARYKLYIKYAIIALVVALVAAGVAFAVSQILEEMSYTEFKFVDDKGNVLYSEKNKIGTEINIGDYTINVEKMYYHFDGWYLSTKPNEKITKFVVSKDLVIVGKWIPDEYSIIYVLDEGVNNASNPSKFTCESVVELNDPSREGYDFDGWYLDPDFENQVTSLEFAPHDITVYAKWVMKMSGSGTLKDPYVIDLDNQLLKLEDNMYYVLKGDLVIRNAILDSNVILNANFDGNGHSFIINGIDISGPIFNSIGKDGVLTNVNFKINGKVTSISDVEYTSLICEENNGTINHVEVMVDVSFDTSLPDSIKTNLGCLVGNNKGTINSCAVSGKIIVDGKFADVSIAGICGLNNDKCTISDVENTATISSNNSTGICLKNEGILDKVQNKGIIVATGKNTSAAGICLGNYSTITNSVNNGKIMANDVSVNAIIAGIVNANYGKVTNCTSNNDFSGENVTGTVTVGGLVGVNNGELTKCSGDSAVFDFNGAKSVSVGLICGINDTNGLVESCGVNIPSNSLKLTIKNTKEQNLLGGIVAENSGKISICKNTLTISPDTSDAMIVGAIVGKNNKGGAIRNTYNTGRIIGKKSNANLDSYFGGIVGANSGIVSYCYNSAEIDCVGKGIAGGIVGFDDNGEYTYVYWMYYLAGSASFGAGNDSALTSIVKHTKSNSLTIDAKKSFSTSIWKFTEEYPVFK